MLECNDGLWLFLTGDAGCVGADCLLLCLLFAVGYFLGTVENKREFMKTAANRLIPDKEVKVIDLKTELKREQEANQAAAEAEEKE